MKLFDQLCALLVLAATLQIIIPAAPAIIERIMQ
jgi:hypothetical protein